MVPPYGGFVKGSSHLVMAPGFVYTLTVNKKKSRNNKQDVLLLIFFVGVFIALRSINFMRYLTFFGWDQAEHAILALNLFRSKDLVLIGPRVSAVLYQGRQIFLGPAMTYLMTFLLGLSNWDPAAASYLFMILSGIMIIPLYYGMKWLTGRRAAWITVVFYTLLPYYLTYTRFLWNPNFQFALLPVFVFLAGYYQKTKKNWVFFILSLWLGVLFQLHYQFIISIIFIFIYYFLYRKEGLKKFIIFCAGFVAGVSPLILFELRNQFYLTKTLMLFVKHINELEMRGSRNHYYLSQSFVLMIGLLILTKKYVEKIKPKVFFVFISLLAAILFSFSAKITFIRPDTAFWSPTPYWDYSVEVKTYEIIKNERLKDFNVTNQLYDSLAMLQKYMMMRDNIVINYDDYRKNKYLFVIDKAGKENYMDNPGYEVLFFRPYRLLKTWALNDRYSMHLVERLKLK